MTLPMKFWHTWDDGGLVRVPGGDRVTPEVRALKRSQVHPSAVFELEDSGFAAAHALDILLGTAFFLLAATVVVLVGIMLALYKKNKRKTADEVGK